MRPYTIYPIKGEAAKDYLRTLGCSLEVEQLNIPDSLLVVASRNNETTYAVMRGCATVFCLQLYASNRWRVIVPASYRITFSTLLQSYRLNRLAAESIIVAPGVLDKLMQNVPVPRSVAITALNQLSDHTTHPYDLDNVRVALAE